MSFLFHNRSLQKFLFATIFIFENLLDKFGLDKYIYVVNSIKFNNVFLVDYLDFCTLQ